MIVCRFVGALRSKGQVNVGSAPLCAQALRTATEHHSHLQPGVAVEEEVEAVRRHNARIYNSTWQHVTPADFRVRTGTTSHLGKSWTIPNLQIR